MKPLALAALVLLSAAGPRAQAPPPATVILLLDITASMTLVPLPFDQRYAQVFNAFLQGLGPSDRAAVGVVAGNCPPPCGDCCGSPMPSGSGRRPCGMRSTPRCR
jgi:hypothetical protein